MNELIKKVEQWAIDRNLHTADSKGQALKVVEECTEMMLAVKDDEIELILDGVGDTYVTMIILCQQKGVKFSYLKGMIDSHELTKNQNNEDLEKLIYYSLNRITTGVSKGQGFKMNLGILGMLEVLRVVANKHDLTDFQCLSAAYNEIKERTGKMVDGVFVKSEDLK